MIILRIILAAAFLAGCLFTVVFGFGVLIWAVNLWLS